MDNENNMIQWTIWYNVQYSIIAYNITIQYNTQYNTIKWSQYDTIYNGYNIQCNNTSEQCHNYNILTTILKQYFIVYNDGYNTLQYATIL